MMVDVDSLKPIFSGIQKFSTIDFDGKLCAVLFTGGCNFRCHFCHNPDFVIPKRISFKPVLEIVEFLRKRVGQLEGIVICGGEPTLWGEDLLEWMRFIKSLGFFVKLDTNAVRSDVVASVVEEDLVDYFAVDYKAPIDKYEGVIGVNIINLKENLFSGLRLIVDSGVDYELRTTVHSDFHCEEDIDLMISELKGLGVRKYFLQNFVIQDDMVGEVSDGVGTRSLVEKFKEKLSESFEVSDVRNLS